VQRAASHACNNAPLRPVAAEYGALKQGAIELLKAQNAAIIEVIEGSLILKKSDCAAQK